MANDSQKYLDSLMGQSDGTQEPADSQQPSNDVNKQQPKSDAESYLGQLASKPTPIDLTKRGSAPTNAIDESPLSLAQRAMLGWVQTPQEQEKYLKQKFDDVKTFNTGDGVGFAVKKGDSWYQADPSFHWEFSPTAAAAGATAGAVGGGPVGAVILGAGAGFAPSFFDGKNLKQLPGDAAQMIGQYGLRSIGAGLGAAAVMGTAGGALAAAPFAAAVAGIGGAAAGSTIAEGVDLAGRAALMNPSTPGAMPAKTANDVYKQLQLAALYGAGQELGGKIGGAVMGKATDTMAGVIKALGNSPEGRSVVRSIFTTLGANANTTEARLLNPARNAVYDEIAAKDALSPLDLRNQQLSKMEDGVFNDIHGQLQSAVSKEGGEFAKLKADPAVRNAKIDSSNTLNDAVQMLKDQGIVTKGGQVNMAREYGDGDVAAVNRLLRASKNSSEMSYDDARNMTQDLNTIMNRGTSNDAVFAALAKAKAGIHQDIATGVGDVNGVKYGDILNKYSTAKGLLQDFSKMTDGAQKKATFVNKIMSTDAQNSGKELMKNLADIGVGEDDIHKLLQMQGARQATSWFGGPKFKGVPLPGGGKAQALAVTNGAKIYGETLGAPAPKAVLPYLGELFKGMRSMDPAQRSILLRNPKALGALNQMAQDASSGEQAQTQSLLQSSGVIPNNGQGGQQQ